MARSELKWRAHRIWPWLFALRCDCCHARFVRKPGYQAWEGYAWRPYGSYIPLALGMHLHIFCGNCVADEQEAIVLARQLLSGVPPFHPATNRCEED